MTLPLDVLKILETLESHGFEGYAVGGCVRDYLMGNTPLDYDLTTDATPTDMMQMFEKTIDTGANFGTITVMMGQMAYELTTYRTETGYDDFRKPSEVAFSTDILEDLQRRDFTMNAIAYHPAKGYVDPYGGRADIEAKVVRAVGEPAERFTEDALRMLRCLRFAAKLDFAIDSLTYTAILTCKPLIAHISIERIREELVKMLMADKVEKMQALTTTGLLEPVDKALAEHLRTHLSTALPQVKEAPKSLNIRLALLFMADPAPKKQLTFLKCSNAQMKEITQLIENSHRPIAGNDRYGLKRLLLALGEETTEKLLVIKTIQGEDVLRAKEVLADILAKKEPLTLKELAIDGGVLINEGITKAGKALGELLNHLHEQVLKAPELNQREALLDMAKTFAQERKCES